MINGRQNFRLRKQLDMTWSVPDQKIEGEAIIFNISLTGLLFVTDRLFEPAQGLTMYFKLAGAPAFPPKGKLVRFRKVGPGQAKCQCGVKFLDDAQHSPAWVKWVEENILKLGNTEDSRILDRFLNEGIES